MSKDRSPKVIKIAMVVALVAIAVFVGYMLFAAPKSNNAVDSGSPNIGSSGSPAGPVISAVSLPPLDSPRETQKDAEETIASLANDSFKVEIGEENGQPTIRLIYTGVAGLGDHELALLKEPFLESLDGSRELFTNYANALRDASGNDEASVVVRCLTEDGAEICSKTYSSKAD